MTDAIEILVTIIIGCFIINNNNIYYISFLSANLGERIL